MKILEAEIDLRAETRVAEQAREGMALADFDLAANKLSTTQKELRVRVDDVIERIEQLPKPEDFKKEIGLLTAVSDVMYEAETILGRPDTGPQAVAAETEAIELLLQAKRNNGGGGGGGSSPSPSGSRNGAPTKTAALAMVGDGSNLKGRETVRAVSQASGEAGESFPEEFRSALDEYFRRLESDE